MSAGKLFKTVFRRIRGRIVPVRISLAGGPDDIQKIMHVKKARSVLRGRKTATDVWDRKMEAAFYGIAKKQSKEVGSNIAKRLNKLRKKVG